MQDHRAVELSHEEIRRYGRHLVMPEVGVEGQKRLKAGSVLIVGAGGLGSPAALYLAAAGVGRIGLVDFDVVDETNLQRQVLYGTSEVGQPKLQAAMKRLSDLNPMVRIELHEARLTSANALDILRGYDVVLDGTDNFPARYLVNDACVLLGKPNVHGSIFRFDGQVSVFCAPGGPCYRCLFPEPPPPGMVPSCAEAGVLGVLPGIVGSIQAAEAIKLLLGKGNPLVGRLLIIDALSMRFRELAIQQDKRCPVCGPNRSITELIDYEGFCGVSEHAPALPAELEITPRELSRRLQAGERLVILDVRTPEEWRICHLDGAKLIPVADLPSRLDELDARQEIVVHCKSGVRSARAVKMLLEAGFCNVRNLKGGILAWAEEVDPALPTY